MVQFIRYWPFDLYADIYDSFVNVLPGFGNLKAIHADYCVALYAQLTAPVTNRTVITNEFEGTFDTIETNNPTANNTYFVSLTFKINETKCEIQFPSVFILSLNMAQSPRKSHPLNAFPTTEKLNFCGGGQSQTLYFMMEK